MLTQKFPNSIINIGQGNITYILIRKELIKRLLSYEYDKLSKPSLMIFFILLSELNDNFKTLFQRELAKKYNISESSFSRALKWFIDNNFIESSKEYKKQFRFSLNGFYTEENIIQDFKEKNPNPFFLNSLVSKLKKDMFIISDADNSYVKELIKKLQTDSEIGIFIPPSSKEKYEPPKNHLEFMKYCEKYANLTPEIKAQIQSYQDIYPEIFTVTQGKQFVLTNWGIVTGIINDFNPKRLYSNVIGPPPKAAMYMLLYLLTLMDSYHYDSINPLILSAQLNVKKSVIVTGLKYLEKANFIERDSNNKKNWKFAKSYFCIDTNLV